MSHFKAKLVNTCQKGIVILVKTISKIDENQIDLYYKRSVNDCEAKPVNTDQKVPQILVKTAPKV